MKSWTSALTLAGLLCAGTAMASGEPSPGALSAQTLRLPDGPGSVRGLSDSASVDAFSGQLTYAVPLELPAGPGEVAPSLSLVYSGESGNGSLGVGWKLALPAIRRSLRVGVPKYTASDELELERLGETGRLVLLAGGSYRLEGAGNAYRIDVEGAGFRVRGPDGTAYVLGTTADARAENAGRVAAWFVKEIHPQNGEVIRFTYAQSGGQSYPRSLTWGPQSRFRCELTYETRKDSTVSYRTGFRVVTDQRVTHISVYAAGQVLREYALSYDETFPLSRLSGVVMLGRAGEGSLPPLSFRYQAPVALPPAIVELAGGWQLNVKGVSVADVDGDGIGDLLRVDSTGHSFRRGRGATFDAAVAMGGLPLLPLDAVRTVDLDGDLRPEIVRTQGSFLRVHKLSGTQWVDAGDLVGSDFLSSSDTTLAYGDLNGDGRVDVMRSTSSGLSVKMSRAPPAAMGLEPWVTRPVLGGDQSVVLGRTARLHEVNGDGLADAVLFLAGSYRVYLGHGDGTFDPGMSFAYPWLSGTTPTSDIRPCDLNRDGLMDVVRINGSRADWHPGLPQGGISPLPRTLTAPRVFSNAVVTFADVNGNGSEDVLWSDANGMGFLDVAGTGASGLLSQIDNGMGKTTSFAYQATSQLVLADEAAGKPWTRKLPMVLPFVSETVVRPGAADAPRVTRYALKDGVWDSTERRLAGFLKVRQHSGAETRAEELVEETDFHPGAGANRVLRGKRLKTRSTDGNGRLLFETDSTWSAARVASLPDVPLLKVAVMTSQTERRFEGALTAVTTRATYQYDGEARLFRETELGRTNVSGDERVTERTYGSDDVTWVRNAPIEVKRLSASGALLSHERRYYGDDASLHPLGVVGKGWLRKTERLLRDPSGDRFVVDTQSRFDHHGNVVAAYDDGVWRSIEYDANGLNPLRERFEPVAGETLEYTAAWDPVLDKPVRLADADGRATLMTYDSLGRLTSLAEEGKEPHRRFVYDWQAPAPKTFTYSFDGRAEELAGSWTGSWQPAGRWRETVETTNGAGEPTFTATRLESVRWVVSEWLERNTRGKIVRVFDAFYWPQTAPPTTRPAEAGKAQTLMYDALGRWVRHVLSDGKTQRRTVRAFEVDQIVPELATVTRKYDGLGRLVGTNRTVNGTVESTAASYDAADQLRTLTLQNLVTQIFDYDSLGRLTYATDPDIGPRWLRYNDAGQLTEQINAAGQNRKYTYDGAGRLTQEDGGPGALWSYHYDKPRSGVVAEGTAGRMAWVQEPTGELHFSYDARGNRKWVRRSIDGVTAEEFVEFSPSGLVLEIRTDDGFKLVQQYDAAGRIRQAGEWWTAVSADARGLPTEERFGNGLKQIVQRDVLGLASRVTLSRVGSPLYDIQLGRNGRGLVTSVTDLDARGLNHSATFAYDAAGRLEVSTVGPVAQQYSFAQEYDALSNLRARHVSGPKDIGVFAGQYAYGENGAGPRQLTSITLGTQRKSFTYDAAGRVTGHAGAKLTYDGLDQLTRVEQPKPDGTTGVITHRYGYEGLRISTQGLDGKTQLWFSPRLTIKDGKRLHYVTVGERTVARVTWSSTAAPTVVYFHQGFSAGPAVLTRNDGTIADERRYEPFGQPIDAFRENAGGSIVTTVNHRLEPRNNLNKDTDPDTGWSYHGARWLTPQTALWLTPDPPVKVPNEAYVAEPWNSHPYQYAMQNPVLYWDPDGRTADIAPGAGGSAPKSSGQYLNESLITGREYVSAAKDAAVAYGPLVGDALFNAALEAGDFLDTALQVIVSVGPCGCSESGERSAGNRIDEFRSNSKDRQMAMDNSRKQADQKWAARGSPSSTLSKQKMFGAEGTQMTSKTIWKGQQGRRIDVENPNPGQRPGQIHFQQGDAKYLYDPTTKTFKDAPKAVNELLKSSELTAVIEKGLRFLGETQ